MSADRDELRRLVDELPEREIPAVLAEVRHRAHPEFTPEWPPAFFASFSSGRGDLAARHNDALAEVAPPRERKPSRL
ncbi:hypothetical protein [Pseudonocardia acaciae]|uniref:hypothetical protein n=1 Tax=Pseudonocardia acaciae TaxID=551276 RepID=UPI00056BEC92|nr:hypothetical protein [Pseudonocardia acaciae]